MNLRYYLFISTFLFLTSCDQTFIPINPQVEELKIEVEKSVDGEDYEVLETYSENP